MSRVETAEFADFYAATFHHVAAQLHAYLGDRAEAQVEPGTPYKGAAKQPARTCVRDRAALIVVTLTA